MANTVKTKSKEKGKGFSRFFKRIGRGCKEIVSELKKVTWPTFGKTLSQTGIVLVVVLFFLVIICAFDFGLNALFKLLIS